MGPEPRGERLRAEIETCFKRHGAPFGVSGLGSIMNIHPRGSATTVAAWRRLLFFDLLRHGVYFAPRGLIVLSLVTNDEDIAAFASALDETLHARRALFTVSMEKEESAA